MDLMFYLTARRLYIISAKLAKYFHLLPYRAMKRTAGLAQSVERGTFNPEVKGSTPLFGEIFFFSQSTSSMPHASSIYFTQK